MAESDVLLRTIADTLDGLDVAMCVFDQDDRTLLWNRAFIRFFPEHANHVHVGEAYRANLRRFYEGRLDADEISSIDRYIEEGIARHHGQQRPYTFKHRGRWLLVASHVLPGIGRVRVWSRSAVPRLSDTEERAAGSPAPAVADDTELFEHVGDGVMLTDVANGVTWVNEHFVRMYALADKAAAVGRQFEDVYRGAWRGHEGADQVVYEAGLATLTENMRFAGAPFELPLPGACWVRVIEQRRRDGVGFFAHVDISVLKRQQNELILAERLARDSQTLLHEKSRMLEATLERMEQGVMMVNAQRVVEVCNRRAIELLGLPPELMASRPTFAQVLEYQWSTNEFAQTPEDVRHFVRGGGIHDQPQCYDRKRPDGRVIEVQSVPIEGGGVLRTYNDITERRRQEDRIRHLASHDGLTALVNRGTFLEHVELAVNNLAANAAGFAVHYLDLDRFKPVNDRLGHAVGDKLLAIVAERLQGVVRDADIVGRMGGDEFAILQANVKDAEQALQLAKRALQSVQQPIEIEGYVVQVGLSVGIALYPEHGSTTGSLMRNADAALYAAKACGRGGVSVFGETAGSRP